MDMPEYMKVPIRYALQDITDKYNLTGKIRPSGYVYVKIEKGIYGLK